MTSSTQPLLASTDGPHNIATRSVAFDDGPLAGTSERITRAQTIDGREAIVSFHGDGFYWLTDLGTPPPGEAQHAVWEPCPDARFSWSRDV